MPPAYRHIIYIRFPYLAASRLQRKTDVALPLVMIKKIRGSDTVVSGCARAAAYGLDGGMRLADARALCPDVIIEDCNPDADHADLHHLALWARRYSPITGVDQKSYGIWLDIAGAEHLFGGVRGLLANCTKRLHRSNLRVIIAAAPTYGAAWALAHYGQASKRLITAPKSAASQPDVTAYMISSTCLRHHLAPLPIAALRIDTDIVDHMQRVGLRMIGDITGLARAPLAARFGTDVLLRLDQALGNEDEIVTPVSPPQPRYVCRQFAQPIGAPDDVKAMIDYLAIEAAALLEQVGLATRQLRLGWQLVDGLVFAHDVHLSYPSRDVASFHRLLANASDKINPEFGLEMGWMEMLDCSPLAPLEITLPRMARQQQDFAAARNAYTSLLDRLVARLGYGAVVSLAPQDTWQPEAGQSFEPPDPEQLFGGPRKKAVWLGNSACATASSRPIRLLAYPQPVDVVALLPDHPPAQFIWKKCTHKIIYATGPERIAPTWWQAPKGSQTRDYFRLRDDQGAGFWLYREGLPERNETPAWFLHGFFA
ncbi:DNA polymerase Y family protein [Candidatus Puniceispirillum sp.]|nr:DNA polymerase Y family protein [Candidatus Puniceispirillum sp.]